MRVPAELCKPDANGQVPLAQYVPKLVPPTAIITDQAEVQNLVETVKKQAAPPGTHPEINPSKAGHKVDVAKQTAVKLAQTGGQLAAYSIMTGGGGFLTLPMSVAGPLGVIGGTIGVIAGLDQAKEALNLKAYYENLKAEGTTVIPIQVPVQTKDGTQVQVQEVSVDALIKGARDTAIVGGLTSAAGIATAAAGLAGAAPLAVAAIVIGVGAALYQARGQLAMVGKALAEKVKGWFKKDEAEEGKDAGTAQAQPQAPTPQATPPPPQVEAPQEAFIAGEKPK
ncbi:MAG: hypothetical protein FJX76_20390 [Armatimonadetes bacterium]|nr:hypothetical protein [Armatimonadota bacterium]